MIDLVKLSRLLERKARVEVPEDREAREAAEAFQAGQVPVEHYVGKQRPGFKTTHQGRTYLQTITGPYLLTSIPVEKIISAQPFRSTKHLDKWGKVVRRAQGMGFEPENVVEPLQTSVQRSNGQYLLEDGHHRFDKLKEAGATHVKAWVPVRKERRKEKSEYQQLVDHYHNQGSGLEPLGILADHLEDKGNPNAAILREPTSLTKAYENHLVKTHYSPEEAARWANHNVAQLVRGGLPVPAFSSFLSTLEHPPTKPRPVRKAARKTPMSYEQANKLLGTRSTKRLSANALLTRGNDGDVHVQLHNTNVVTFHPDDTRTLRMGGYNTLTTRRYQGLAGAYVSSARGKTTVYHPQGHVPFREGMRVDKNGHPFRQEDVLHPENLSLPDFAKHDALIEAGADPKHYLSRIKKAARVFASNNQAQLTLDQALEALGGEEHARFRDQASAALQQAGIQGRAFDSLGAWSDGAENTVAFKFPGQVHPDQVRRAAALVGLMGRQKSVLMFHEDPKGPDILHRINLPGQDPRQAHQSLLTSGLDFHTLVPHRSGTVAMVWDEGGRMRKMVQAMARFHNAKVRESPGRGELVGDTSASPSREAAQARYGDVLATHPGPGANVAPVGQRRPAPRQAGPT